MTDLGKKIKEARKAKNMSQKQLAERLEIAQGVVSRWEQGKASPRRENIEKIEVNLDLVLNIGGWIRRKREEIGMSVPELAEKSGVSIPTIYNIEKGQSENPREATVKNLETVLRDRVPGEVKAASAEASGIEGLGWLQDFEPHDKNEWPDAPGIYLFYDVSQRLVYVGQSGSIKNRFEKLQAKCLVVQEPHSRIRFLY